MIIDRRSLFLFQLLSISACQGPQALTPANLSHVDATSATRPPVASKYPDHDFTLFSGPDASDRALSLQDDSQWTLANIPAGVFLWNVSVSDVQLGPSRSWEDNIQSVLVRKGVLVLFEHSQLQGDYVVVRPTASGDAVNVPGGWSSYFAASEGWLSGLSSGNDGLGVVPSSGELDTLVQKAIIDCRKDRIESRPLTNGDKNRNLSFKFSLYTNYVFLGGVLSGGYNTYESGWFYPRSQTEDGFSGVPNLENVNVQNPDRDRMISTDHLGNFFIKGTDGVSSLNVRKGALVLFDDTDYRGEYIAFSEGEFTGDLNNYEWNDRAKSLIAGPNVPSDIPAFAKDFRLSR